MVEVKLTLTNAVGLHARPAAEFIKTAAKFKSKVTIKGRNKTADAKSILLVITMGLKKGDEMTISVEGPDEQECLDELAKLVVNNFYEK